MPELWDSNNSHGKKTHTFQAIARECSKCSQNEIISTVREMATFFFISVNKDIKLIIKRILITTELWGIHCRLRNVYRQQPMLNRLSLRHRILD